MNRMNGLLERLSFTCNRWDRFDRCHVQTHLDGERIHDHVCDPFNANERRLIVESAVEIATGSPPGEDLDLTPLGKLVIQAAEARENCEPIERLTFAELRAAYPHLHAPVVDGLFRAGETCNIVSHSKIGKSWLAYDLALSIIAGHDWLNRFPTGTGRKVLLVDNELHPPTIASRIPTVAAACSLSPDQYDVDLEVISLRGRLRSLADIAMDFESIAAGEFGCIIFDAKYRFGNGVSENDNAAESQFYNLVDQIAANTGAAVVLVHHTSKGSQSDKRTTDVGAGAGAQSRAADCHLVLREHEEEGVVVLDAVVRSFPPVEPLALRWQFPLWQPADDIDPGKLKGRLTAQEQRQAEQDKQGFDAILGALSKSPATARQLRPLTGIGPDRLQRLLDKLEYAGHVTVRETTIRGNKCREYHPVTDLD